MIERSEARPGARLPRPSIDALVAGTYALFGLRLGVRQIADNSAFTHLRTGMDMVRHGLIPAIPRVDPYTFTAAGHPWVVQSWLAEFAVGWANRLAGGHAVVVLCALAMGALAWLTAILARTGSPGRTALAGAAALAIGVPFWTARPLLAGILCLAATIWIVERRRSPWLLVPLVWIWVNSHGSFPLGLLWILACCAGSWLDGRGPSSRPVDVPWRYAAAFVGGLAASVLNPLGWHLLSFATTAVSKHNIFAGVVEWRTVDFQQPGGTVALVGIVVAVAILARARLPWRHLLPAIGFLAMGLFAQRNLAPLGVVLAPVLAYALGQPRREHPLSDAPAFNTVVAGVLAGLAAVFLFGIPQRPALDFKDVPVRAVTWMEQHHRFDAPHRVATVDTIGNYLELRRGPRADVFIDDRIDLFPVSVSKDYATLLHGGDAAVRSLNRWHIDTVLWNANHPLVQRLIADGDWVQLVRRDRFVVVARRAT